MPNAKNVANRASHITKGDVFDDLGLSHAEALEAKIKADVWRDLVTHIEGLHLKQRDLAARLQVHQPDVSNLLGGKLSKFSVDSLIQYAVRLDLGVHVRLTAPKSSAPKPRKAHGLQAKEPKTRQKERELTAA